MLEFRHESLCRQEIRMAYEFFFSYTRANYNPYLKRLFTDLSDWVRNLTGAGQEDPVGFFDQREIELGAQWDSTIVEALQESKVLVALGSPAYFKSEYCGKEWALFRQRAIAGAPSGNPPPLIKSMVWVPFDIASLPPDVQATQLLRGDPHGQVNEKGLAFLAPRRPVGYQNFINELAEEIVKAGRAHPIARLVDVPPLAQVQSAFHPPPPLAPQPPEVIGPVTHEPEAPVPVQEGRAGSALNPDGPKHVHFVFVAANPRVFGAARQPDAYFASGAGDWKPFFPADLRPIQPLLQQVASHDDLLCSSDEVPFSPQLLEKIDEARERRQLVVIVVDPWSLHWDAQRQPSAYQDLLRELDKRLDYHWCVIVPWNEQDPVWKAGRDAMTATVRSTFDRHANFLPLFYREGITSADDLKGTVADTLRRLKEEVSKRAEVVRPVPPGPARVFVTGPSVAGGAP
jgi:FxsC-like protein